MRNDSINNYNDLNSIKVKPLVEFLKRVGVENLEKSLDMVFDIMLYESERVIDDNEKEALFNISQLKNSLAEIKEI